MQENSKYSNTSKCPTQEALEQYVFSELSNKEQYTIERHLLHCNMCNDAVEGLLLLKNEKELVVVQESIHSKIDKKVNNKKSNIYLFSAIAAGIALLLGIGFLFLAETKTNTQTAVNTTITKESFEGLDTVNQIAVPNNSELEEKKQKETATSKNNDYKQEEQIVSNITDSKVSIGAALATSAYKDVAMDAVEPETLATFDTKALQNMQEPIAETESRADTKEKAPKAVTKNNETISIDALATYAAPAKMESEKKQKAMARSAATSQQEEARQLDQPMNDLAELEANYFSGIKWIEKKNYEKALTFFNGVLKNGDSKFYEDAQISKAKCLLYLDKKEEAKFLLNAIVKQNGKHKQEAEQLLQDGRLK